MYIAGKERTRHTYTHMHTSEEGGSGQDGTGHHRGSFPVHLSIVMFYASTGFIDTLMPSFLHLNRVPIIKQIHALDIVELPQGIDFPDAFRAFNLDLSDIGHQQRSCRQ